MSDKDFVVKNGLVVNTNFVVNSTTVYIGNSISNATVNSSLYSASSNNVLYVGTASDITTRTAANIVSNAQLQSNLSNYVTLVGLSSNVAKLNANSAQYLGPVGSATLYTGWQLRADLPANVAVLPANSAQYLGPAGSALNYTLYVNTAQLAANLSNYLILSGGQDSNRSVSSNVVMANLEIRAGSLVVNISSGIIANGSVGGDRQVLFSNGSTIYWGNMGTAAFSAPGLDKQVIFNDNGSLNAYAGITFNRTSNTLAVGTATINSTFFSQTANNANYLGTAIASDYAKKADVHFIGTTSIALNRSSASQTLSGVNIDGTAYKITSTYDGTLTSSQITTALGYTPVSPGGLGTTTGSYMPLTGGNFTGGISGTSAGFSGAVSGGSGSFGAISGTTGSFSAAVSGTTGSFTDITSSTGRLNLNSATTRYVGFDGTAYNMPSSELNVNGQRVLNAGNYNSYAPTLTGTAATGTWNININGIANNANKLGTYDAGTYLRQGESNRTLYNLYTNIIYDSDNNGYNLDMNGTSRLNTINCDLIRSYNDIIAYWASDINLKTNINIIPDALEKVKKIRGVEFDWTDQFIADNGGEDGYFIRKHDVGVIAQEIEAVLPEVVGTRENGIKAVKYDRIVALLIQAIKEQQKQIEDLQKKVGM